MIPKMKSRQNRYPPSVGQQRQLFDWCTDQMIDDVDLD